MSELTEDNKPGLAELTRFQPSVYREQNSFSGSVIRVYNQILGLRSERMPKMADLPEEILLPSPVFGNYISSIPPKVQLLSQPHEPYYSLKEESECVFWDPKHQIFTYSDVFQGTSGGTSEQSARFMQHIKYWGRKPILSYHTHPYMSTTFSKPDLVAILPNPRLGYMHLVGSERFGALIVQTEKSAKLPLSSNFKSEEIRKDLEAEMYKKYPFYAMNKVKTAELGRYFETKNWGYYLYTPQIQADGVFPNRSFLDSQTIDTIQNSGLRLIRWDIFPADQLHKQNQSVY